MKEVEVLVSIHGDWCSFDEMSFFVEYDITNKKQLGDVSIEEFENMTEDDYDTHSSYEVKEAILFDGKYYVKWGY